MYTQLLKEILLEIEHDGESIEDLITFCRTQYSNNKGSLEKIRKMKDYRHHIPIWWYTAESLLYPMLNRVLRTLEVDTILKMRVLICDLRRHLNLQLIY